MFGSNLLQRTMAYVHYIPTYIYINVGNEKNNHVLIIFIICIWVYVLYVGTSKATIKIGESRAAAICSITAPVETSL
jgi:hypothetical protein